MRLLLKALAFRIIMNSVWGDKFFSRSIAEQHTHKLILMRGAFGNLATELEKLLPDGRYKEMVLTDLEKTAAMATKAFSHNE